MLKSTVNGSPTDSEELYPEPDPDYTNEEDEGFDQPSPEARLTADELSASVAQAQVDQAQNGSDPPVPGSSREAPLIRPKPLPNPCLDSKERQALHRELLMNYKIGKDVLKKPELDKVLRERKEKEKKKAWEEHKSSKERTSLVIKLEERANRLKEEEEKKTKINTEESQAPELTRVFKKITHKTSGQPE